MIYKEKRFSLDSIEETFLGYSTGQKWNGFSCPLFDESTSQAILKASESQGYTWSYNNEKNEFLVSHVEDQYEQPEIFKGNIVTIKDQEVMLYPIGSHSWTWQEYIE